MSSNEIRYYIDNQEKIYEELEKTAQKGVVEEPYRYMGVRE